MLFFRDKFIVIAYVRYIKNRIYINALTKLKTTAHGLRNMSVASMSVQTRQISIAARYNVLLTKYPLLTKMVTGAVLSALSELVSQFTTASKTQDKDEKQLSILQKLASALQKPRYRKLLSMFLYGGLVNAPINHFCYGWITRFTSRNVAPKWKRMAQLCGSWFIVSPVQVFFLVIALTLVNLDQGASKLSQKLDAVKSSLRSKYGPMLSSSVISATAFVSIAQQFIAPEKWSVFFSFAYAALNTGQNIYLKRGAKDSSKERAE
ncbi:KLTH0C08404p [Lachancea thermotolerans CBS 6340]|uniref:KLTH0C08404p n=1 Tax=Lachancea thermotolerans (strain ATCC 56472 / CBS 6340 / NRRL Y-8284) TaxID=559295 RepID=C5DED9_LACTC|nr:KLTH0C08404p [Lachancea thermotolerans CBS 6340]CAR22150.1 KLTH0C08404p [Lachancea thermotolerans CBS 6340]